MRPWSKRTPPAAASVDRVSESERPPTRVHAAPGLQVVLSRLDRSAATKVLDLGPAIGDNVATLGRRAARVQVADCLRKEGRATSYEVEDRLPVCGSGLFDVALAWHLLNYLDREAAVALVRRIAAVCSPGALLHGLIFETETMPASPGKYRIVADGRLRLEATAAAMIPAPNYPPAVVGSLLQGFRIEHAFVLSHGAREYVAERTAQRVAVDPPSRRDR